MLGSSAFPTSRLGHTHKLSTEILDYSFGCLYIIVTCIYSHMSTIKYTHRAACAAPTKLFEGAGESCGELVSQQRSRGARSLARCITRAGSGSPVTHPTHWGTRNSIRTVISWARLNHLGAPAYGRTCTHLWVHWNRIKLIECRDLDYTWIGFELLVS